MDELKETIIKFQKDRNWKQFHTPENLAKSISIEAGELLEHFSMTGASLSHHLSILKNAGLIDDEKKGKFIFYTLNTSVLDDILNWMMSLKKGDSNEES